MSARLLIYGATGFTGSLLARRALQRGLQPVLAGRCRRRLERLSRELGCEYRVAQLDQPAQLDAALEDVDVVLHTAGPFLNTAQPMVAACLRGATHYLDLTGEWPVFERLSRLDEDARNQGLTIMPGVGFAVAATDCLASHVASRFPQARKLYLGVSRAREVSRGSLRTMSALFPYGIGVRRNGVLLTVEPGSVNRDFDYGDGPSASLVAAWPDVVTAWHSTGIPTIETYLEAGGWERGIAGLARWTQALGVTSVWQGVSDRVAEYLPSGPGSNRRSRVNRVVVAEAEDNHGLRVCARVMTPESYDFSVLSAVWIAESVLAGRFEPGFQTPGRVYGDELLHALGCDPEDMVTTSA